MRVGGIGHRGRGKEWVRGKNEGQESCRERERGRKVGKEGERE